MIRSMKISVNAHDSFAVSYEFAVTFPNGEITVFQVRVDHEFATVKDAIEFSQFLIEQSIPKNVISITDARKYVREGFNCAISATRSDHDGDMIDLELAEKRYFKLMDSLPGDYDVCEDDGSCLHSWSYNSCFQVDICGKCGRDRGAS